MNNHDLQPQVVKMDRALYREHINVKAVRNSEKIEIDMCVYGEHESGPRKTLQEKVHFSCRVRTIILHTFAVYCIKITEYIILKK